MAQAKKITTKEEFVRELLEILEEATQTAQAEAQANAQRNKNPMWPMMKCAHVEINMYVNIIPQVLDLEAAHAILENEHQRAACWRERTNRIIQDTMHVPHLEAAKAWIKELDDIIAGFELGKEHDAIYKLTGREHPFMKVYRFLRAQLAECIQNFTMIQAQFDRGSEVN